MLKTSLFNKGIYKSQLSRFKWGSLLYFVLLFFTTSFILLIDDFSYISDYSFERYIKAGGLILDENYLIFPILFATAIPTVVSFLSFDMFSSKRHSVFIHSLPCGRNAVYISTLLGAFTLMAIPVIANGIILMFISVFKLSELYSAFSCLKWIAINLILLFIMFSISVISANLTANRVSMLIINALFHILPLIVVFGIGGVASAYLYGFDDNLNNFIDNTVNWMPISFGWVYNGDNYTRFVNNILSIKCLIFVVGAVVLYLLSLLLYKKRNNEVAGNFVAFKIMNPIFKYTITTLSVIITFSALEFSNFERGFYMAFLLIVISLIAYFASEMLLKKNLKVFGAYKGYLIFVLVCVIANTFFQYTSFFGYENRVPDFDDIKGVTVYDNYYNQEKPYTEDADVIKTALKFHEELILDIPSVIDDSTSNFDRIKIEYELKNGKTFKRTYKNLSNEKKIDILSGLFEYPAYRLASDSVYKLDLNKVQFLRLRFEVSGNYSYNFGIEGRENIKEFIAEWKKDIESLGYKEKTENFIMNISADYETEINSYKESSYVYVSEGFNHNFKNVMKYLENNGYLNEVYKLSGGKIYISKESHKFETKTTDNITRLYFDGEESNTYRIGKNEVIVIDDVDKELIVKDVLNGNLKKNYDDGEKYIIYAVGETVDAFERYAMFLSVEKEELPEYLKKYVQ